MFVGHYGPAFALKPARPAIPLWVLFIAVQGLDIAWTLLVLAGIEKLRVVPGFTEGSPFDLYYMPFSHGLIGAAVLSAVLGAIVAAIMRMERRRVFLVIAAAAFSHWLLDLLVHVPDLPLYDDSAKVGLGLWRSLWISLPLELVTMVLGAWFYARHVPPRRKHGDLWLWAFVALLVVLQLVGTFGPPPASPAAAARAGLGAYLVLALLAGAVDWARGTLRY